MVKKTLKLSLAALILLGSGTYLLKEKVFGHKGAMFEAFENENEEKAEKAEIQGALDYYNLLRADLNTGQVNRDAMLAAYNELMSRPRYKALGSWLDWKEMGPDNVGGRCRAIVIDKDNQSVVYAGGVSGGFWKSVNGGSTWSRTGNRDLANINIVSMAQGADGAIYYGTGENGWAGGNGDGNSGFLGNGVYKSTDRGETFTQLAATNAPNASSPWSDVHVMAADPTDANRIYAGNDGGLYVTTNGGTTWTKVNINSLNNRVCKDLKLSNDGNTIYVSMANNNPGTSYQIWRSDDKGANFKRIDNPANGTKLTTTSVSMVIAISPSNNNVIYVSNALAGSGTDYAILEGIYRSEDKGETWTKIAKGDKFFNPLANQGYYNNCIAVDPKDQDHIVFGGLNLWQGKSVNGTFQFSQLTDWSAEFLNKENTVINPHFVHADQHIAIFDHASPNPNLYIGSDGGVSKSTDFTYNSNPTFFNADYGFNTVQFYNIGVSAVDQNEVIGGAQDNGVIRVDQGGITLKNGSDVRGGDGFHCEISSIIPSLYFGEAYNGTAQRSFDRGKNWNGFFDSNLPAPGTDYPFNTDFSLWENKNDLTSTDTAVYTADQSYTAGQTIQVKSRNSVFFNAKLTKNLAKGDTFRVQDIVQSRFYIAPNGANVAGIYMTRDALISGVTPTWFQIANLPGFTALDIKSSKDGDVVYVAGRSGGYGVVYRIAGLNGKKYQYVNGKFSASAIGITVKQLMLVSGQVATSVAVDPNNPAHILMTFGAYGYSNYVYVSNNALDASPTYTNITGNLPKAPVYASLISMKGPNDYLVGTEFGVWSSRNGGSTWAEENNGMDRVPTFDLKQMNYGDKPWIGPIIYAGTHGRGVFKTTTLTTGINEPKEPVAYTTQLNIFPNPVREFTNLSYDLSSLSEVSISVIDIQGRVLMSSRLGQQGSGNHVYRMDTYDLPKGTYFVRVSTVNGDKTAKMLKVE